MFAPLLDHSSLGDPNKRSLKETRISAGLIERLDKFFEVSARGSTMAAEVRGGASGWMTMSYILVVNPTILHIAAGSSGLTLEALMTATALTSALCSLVVGLVTNMPFGVMPGMGINAYITYSICKALNVSWPKALSCCFVGGLVLFLLSLAGVCDRIVKRCLSDHLKKAITVAIGVFQALIGFEVMGLVVRSPETLVTMGDLSPHWANVQIYLGLAGLLLISFLLVSLRMRGSMLVGILAMALTSWLIGMTPWPTGILSYPSFDGAMIIDFSGWWPGSPELPGLATGAMVILFVCLFDVAGIVNGLAVPTPGGLEDANTTGRSMGVCGLGTMLGAVLGTSPVVVACESSAAIIEGGRTGLSAVVMSFLFFCSLALGPILCAVPRVATAVPLIIVGAFMMAPCKFIEWDNLRVALPSFLTVTVVPFTYSIHNGILAGLLLDAFFDWSSKFFSPQSNSQDGEVDVLSAQLISTEREMSVPRSPPDMSQTDVEDLRSVLKAMLKKPAGGIVFMNGVSISNPLEMAAQGQHSDGVSTAVPSTRGNTMCSATPREEQQGSAAHVLNTMC